MLRSQNCITLAAMSVALAISVVCGIGLLVGYVGSLWWRRRRTARQADELLAKVVKAKDAFRRQ
ncbi:MAG: hypothetical protein OXU40_07355 [Nitrospira sp.]|nr:hypothetical protein [Nitrospira sp.]